MEDILAESLMLQKEIDRHERIVFFGGAGVSTESGIPDFRSQDGLYNQKYKYNPETIISHSFFYSHTDEFYEFYRDRMIYPKARPNACHRYLAKLEKSGKLLAVVTQNIDGLHQMAGSKKVLELHGSIHRNICTSCHKRFNLSAVTESEGIPTCPDCGGLIKPDVVLYGEPLNDKVIDETLHVLSAADMLIVAGTSLVVYPAASFIDVFEGDMLVLIDKNDNIRKDKADMFLKGEVGKIFGGLK